ncbi:glycosyltransferase family 2 protein, partial [Burkholderia cepacia]|nr:glycosyltransferase [Burkholderia cepacia]
MKISVLVPTYRRPADLARCLLALQRQQRLPDEVIVVARPEDDATHERLA